jgi:hypothetical protein
MTSNEITAIKIFIMTEDLRRTSHNQNLELRDMVNLNLVNKIFYKTLIFYFQTIKSGTIENLLEKYNIYGYYQKLRYDEVNVPSVLYDALSSGCDLPLVKSSKKYMDNEVEVDIYKIVKLIPCSIYWNYGMFRNYYNANPLYMACMNEKVSIRIIKLLLDHGVNIYNYHGNILICDLMEPWQNKQRITAIKDLFAEHIQKTNIANI